MADEELVVEQTTPEPEATATPETVVPEMPEVKPVETPKTFTQEELDAAIGKRLAREQRKWEREHAQHQPEKAELPKADQFENVEAYAEALIQKKLEQKQQAEVLEAYRDREEEAQEKYADFKQVAYNPELKITTTMAETIRTSDIGPDVAYYLGVNPKEADRISRLAPLAQAKEIGRIEAKLASDPPVKKTTSAPAPIVPVTARSSGVPSYDTTDPRSVKSMSMAEWAAAEELRIRKKWEAQNR